MSFNAVSGDYYFIRVIVVNDDLDLSGQLSIYPGPRPQGDLCRDAVELTLRTCDFPFNVSANFVNDEALDAACGNGGGTFIDGWARVFLEANQEIRVEYIK
ncbi:MAG: hypothetical protein HC880_14780 [Bacteroidia bacterium]|nr:hypothetical protein [Bacteroidia bacterium]